MTELAAFFLGWRDFWARESVAAHITQSVNFDATSESPLDAKTLLLFETSKQHTWLVATRQRLYCILDDVRKPEPHINWSMGRSRIVSDGEVILEIRSRNRGEQTGLVDLGPDHRGWLYTRDLFEGGDVVSAIRDFLTKAMA